MAQISIVDSGSDIIVTDSGVSQSYPKQNVRTRKDTANTILLLLHGERVIKVIKNKADVTNITSTNLADLQTKIINVLNTTPSGGTGGTGGITTETDPTVPIHVKSISQENITAWNGTAASAHTHANKAALDAITGVNTGDQDLSGLATKNNTTLTGLTTVQNLKITGGTPGVGKILTSDADGDAVWTAPVAGVTIDATPTDGSTNAVSSNGVFDALAGKVDLSALVGYVDTATDQDVAGVKNFTSGLRTTVNATIANGATLNVFNTANETTASEALRMSWTGNIAYIQTVQTGGTLRPLTIGLNTAANININNTGGASGYFTFSRNTNVIGTLVNIGKSSTFTHASGVTSVLGILNTVNQSGTAGYNGIYVSIYEQAVGTGVKNLLDLGTNTADNNGGTHTSRFSVSNTGAVAVSDIANFRGVWSGTQAVFGSTGQAGRIGFGRSSDGAISTRLGYTSAAESSAFEFSNTTGNGSFSFTMSAGTAFRIYNDGNIIAQTGGTFTNSGDKFQVTGTSRLAGKLTVVASDAEFTTTATGPVIIDRSTGLKRRIICSNGVINTEAVA